MTYGSGHYWASEDLNTTGENVGITLDSMCDIIMANDVTSGNVVVFIPGDIEHGQKGHFALGEGGGGSTEIDASIYQVIVGDGEGNGVGAQGGAEAQENNKIYLKNKRLGPNIPTHEDDGTPLVGVDTGSFTIASNALGHTHAETVYDEELESDVEVQVEDDGWKATIEDYGKVKVSGKSKIIIGETDTTYEGNDRGVFWDDRLEGPDVNIGACAKIEFKESSVQGTSAAVPAVSIRGNCLIDMSNEVDLNYNWRQRQLSGFKGGMERISPFANATDGPVLQLKGCPIVAFQDQALVQVKNGAQVEIGGNARLHIVGGEWDNGTSTNGLGVKSMTNIMTGPGFHAELYGSMQGDVYSTFLMNPGNLILSTQYLTSDGVQDNGYLNNFNNLYYDASLARDSYSTGANLNASDWNIFHLCRLSPSYNTNKAPLYDSTSDIRYDNRRLRQLYASPTFSMSNGVMVSYTTGDESAIGIGIGAADGGTIDADITTTGHINIRAGLDNRGDRFLFELGSVPSKPTDSLIKIALGGKLRALFEPYDNTSLNFCPAGPFGFFCNAKQTEVNFEWSKFYGLFGGADVFAQVDGNSHFESWSGTIILRGSNNLRDYNGSESSHRAHYPYFISPTKNRTVTGTTIINADLSNMSTADIESTYASQLKTATALPISADVYTWTGFSGTSKTKIPQEYKEALDVSSCTCIGNLTNIVLYGNYETWNEIYNSNEFKEYIKTNTKCANNPTFNAVTGGEITSKGQYSDGRYYYYGTFPVNITNITYRYTSGGSTTKIDPAYSNCIVAQSSYAGGMEMRKKLIGAPSSNYEIGKIFKFPSSYSPSYSVINNYKYNESITLEDITFNQDGGAYGNGAVSVTISNYINLNNTTVAQFLQNAQVLASLRSTIGNFTSIEPMENCTVTYDRYQWSRYYYTLKFFIVHFDTYSLTNTFYGTNNTDGAKLNLANTNFTDLSGTDQNYIKGQIVRSATNEYVGTWDWSEAHFSDDYAVTEEPRYEVSTTSSYTGETESHLGKNWRGPIQTADRIGESDWDKSPIIQAYGPVNICVREKYAPGTAYSMTVTTTENEFDLTDMGAAIRAFVASSHYQELLDYITTNYPTKELYYINQINSTASTTEYVVYFFLKDNNWSLEVASHTNTPVVDITEGSELRIYGGAKIKAVTEYGETTYEFSSADSNEEPVSFTLAELKALKALLNPPL